MMHQPSPRLAPRAGALATATLAATALALTACSSSGGHPSGAASPTANVNYGRFAGVIFHGSIYVSSQDPNGPKSWRLTKTFLDRVHGIRSCKDAAKTGDAAMAGVFEVPTGQAPVPEDAIDIAGFRGPGTYPPGLLQHDKSDSILISGKTGKQQYVISSDIHGLTPGREVLFMNANGSGQLAYSEAHLDGRASGPAVAGLITWTCTAA
jgi:hypothetical protein